MAVDMLVFVLAFHPSTSLLGPGALREPAL
jgi:hypothetical protein